MLFRSGVKKNKSTHLHNIPSAIRASEYKEIAVIIGFDLSGPTKQIRDVAKICMTRLSTEQSR